MEFNVRFDRSYMPPRTVKTVFALDEVNEFISQGHLVLFEKVKPNKKLYSKGFIFQSAKDSRCIFAPSRHFPVQHSGWETLSEDEWNEVMPITEYARERSLNYTWAAYVMPLAPEVGETFYVEDLIEDILVSEFWGSKIYAVDGIATWNGSALKFRRELYDSGECMIVG